MQNNKSLNGLYTVISEPKIKIVRIWNYDEVYTVFCNYKNGTLELQKPLREHCQSRYADSQKVKINLKKYFAPTQI